MICVYTRIEFQGERRCFETQADLCTAEFGGCNGDWNDQIRSIEFKANVGRVELYDQAGYKGLLTTLTTSQPTLPRMFQSVTSFKIVEQEATAAPVKEKGVFPYPGLPGLKEGQKQAEMKSASVAEP